MTSISASLYASAGRDVRPGAPSLSRNWGSFVVRGALALILGTVAFLFPVSALFAFTMLFAAYAGADGLLSTIAGCGARHARRSTGGHSFYVSPSGWRSRPCSC